MAEVKGRLILLLRIAGGLEKAFQLCPITSPWLQKCSLGVWTPFSPHTTEQGRLPAWTGLLPCAKWKGWWFCVCPMWGCHHMNPQITLSNSFSSTYCGLPAVYSGQHGDDQVKFSASVMKMNFKKVETTLLVFEPRTPAIISDVFQWSWWFALGETVAFGEQQVLLLPFLNCP